MGNEFYTTSERISDENDDYLVALDKKCQENLQEEEKEGLRVLESLYNDCIKQKNAKKDFEKEDYKKWIEEKYPQGSWISDEKSLHATYAKEFEQRANERKQREKEEAFNRKLKEKVRQHGVKVLERFVRIYTKKRDVVLEETDQESIFNIHVGKMDFLDQLPDGYVYKGGAARSALEHFLKIDEHSRPRDIDIAVLPWEGDVHTSRYLSEKYMPDDYSHGHGVERLENDYFETRDFTINEILYDGEKITASYQCILDTVRSVIRIADYEIQERYYDDGDYFVNPKLLAKALRFIAQKAVWGKQISFKNEEAITWIGIDSFHAALHLDRAMDMGEDVALRYIEELKKVGGLPEDINTLKKAVSYLQKDLYDFVFKAQLYSQIVLDDDLDRWSNIEDEYVLPTRESFSKK